MIGCPCLCTGADSTNGIDSTLGTDSSPGIDSILEPIPCDSDSGSFGYNSNSGSGSRKKWNQNTTNANIPTRIAKIAPRDGGLSRFAPLNVSHSRLSRTSSITLTGSSPATPKRRARSL